MQRPAHGTWLAMTKQGRIAVLTNFRENDDVVIEGVRSRGEIPIAYLTVPAESSETPEEFAKRMVEQESVKGVGGFSLIFGQLHAGKTVGERGSMLGIISNRTSNTDGVVWITGDKVQTIGQTCALSNSHFGDRAWPKVVRGEELMSVALEESAKLGEAQEKLIDRLFAVLSVDTMPKRKEGERWTSYVKELRHSILIPPISELAEKPADEVAAAKSDEAVSNATGTGSYGTQKQTVVLVDRAGKTTFVERTLFDENARRVPDAQRDLRFDFDIQGWKP